MLIGLVGKPSSGKSTLFNALTLLDAPMANYPFTTIDPNKGVGHVSVECVDKELNVSCQPVHGRCEKGTRFVPVELMDVAGLVPGSHKGRGKGNAFLNDLSTADVLIHVVDAAGATNEEGEPCEPGAHDPAKDVRFLEEELNLWFAGVVERNWVKFARVPAKSKSARIDFLSQNLAGLGAARGHVEEALEKCGRGEKALNEWREEERRDFAFALRSASKPIVVAANKADLEVGRKNAEKLKKEFPDTPVFACSAVSELTLRKAAKQGAISYKPGDSDFEAKGKLSGEQEKGLSYIREHVLKPLGRTGVQALLDRVVFDVLKRVAVFPVASHKLTDSEGRVLPDCFLMPSDSTVLDFAFKLHTDIGSNFVRAVNVKTKQMVGKDTPVHHRDVLEIIHKAK